MTCQGGKVETNEQCDEVMSDLKNWSARPAPALAAVTGEYVRIERARFPEDGAALFDVLGGAGNENLWRYVPLGPFDDAKDFIAAMSGAIHQFGWQTYLLSDAVTGEALGMASYMRIRPDVGSAEVGCIVFSKKLQRTPAATEAMYLMARHIFDELGYRRYEWKCNNANESSKNAALRLGFVFEGVFRQDMVVKGQNRDTAWYSILDSEWPKVRAAFEAWLRPENFDEDGRQRQSLSSLREAKQ